MNTNGYAKSTINPAAILLLGLAVFLGSAATTLGATRTWDGSSSALWSNRFNWTGNVAPSNGDSLVFPASASNKNNSNDIVGLDVLSIEIAGTGYTLSGNSIGLIDSIRLNTTFGMLASMYMDIELVDDAQIRMMGYNNTLHCHGDIDTGSHVLNVGNYGAVFLYGPVGGSGSVVKFGSGTVYMKGTSANTYAGLTTVEDGTLVLDQDAGNSIPYDLVIEDGATVRQEASARIGDDVTINKTGIYDMNGFNETIGDLILNDGADFDSGAGKLTIRGDVVVDGGISSISGSLGMMSGDRDFNILYNGWLIWPGAHCYLNADVSGTGNLVKKGPGDMRISGNNTYSGTTVVENGDIMVESDTALGTTAGGTTVNVGSRMYISAFSSGSSKHIAGETLSLGGEFRSYGVSNSWTGAITLTDDADLFVSSGDYLNLAGAVGGSGGLAKEWAGTLILSGSGNDYSGDTEVNEGTLELQGSNRIRYGTLVVGDGAGAKESVVVRFLSSSPIHSAADVVIKADGLLDFNDYTDDLGYVLFDRGQLKTGTGEFRMLGNVGAIESFSTNWVARISGNVDLGTSQRTFDIDAGTAFYLSAHTRGNGGIAKTGGGQLYLASSNSYAGATSVNEGLVYVDNDHSLGETSGGTTVGAGASLVLRSDNDIGNEALTLSGSGNSILGALACIYGSSSWAGPVTLSGAVRLTTLQVGDTLDIGGAIGGSGDVTLEGSGTIIYSGSAANTYTGDTYVNKGTLELDKSIYNASIPGNLYIGDGNGGVDADVVRMVSTSQIPNNTRITIAGSGLFDMNNQTEYFGSLEGSGHVDMGSGHLGVGYDNGSTRFSGLIEGSGELRKFGTGTFELSGNNTYSGDTEVNAGVVLVNGSQSTSDVVVYSSGTLGGIGTVGAIASSGTVAPGASAGQLGCGSATLNSGSYFEVELDGHLPVDYDQLDVNGAASLGNANLDVAWGFVPAVGDEFTILDNDGTDAVAGTFNGLPEGASVVAGNVTLQITYAGGTGNDVVLAATEVTPLEPLMITSISPNPTNVLLEWEGGMPYFQVEKKTTLTNGTWTAVTAPTRDLATSLPVDTTNGFYRVTGGN